MSDNSKKPYVPPMPAVYAFAMSMMWSLSWFTPVIMAPDFWPEKRITDVCIDDLTKDTQRTVTQGQITIEFSEKALADCIAQRRENLQTMAEEYTKIGGAGLAVLALSGAWMGIGAYRHKRAQDQKPNPPAP